MLTAVQMRNRDRSDLGTLELPLVGNSSFPIRFIDGLGPVKADVSKSEYAQLNRDFIENTRVGSRNIVLTLDLEPDWTVGETVDGLRDIVYDFASPQDRVHLTFVKDDTSWEIEGVVESCEPPMFVKDPAVQISVICEDPAFETPLLSYSEIVPNGTPFTIVNGSKLPAPFQLTALNGAPAQGFELYVESGPGQANFSASGTYPTNTQVVLNTRPGEKTYDIFGIRKMFLITAGSEWPALRPGVNNVRVRFVSEAAFDNNISISYRERTPGL